jgi:hypothetical protein
VAQVVAASASSTSTSLSKTSRSFFRRCVETSLYDNEPTVPIFKEEWGIDTDKLEFHPPTFVQVYEYNNDNTNDDITAASDTNNRLVDDHGENETRIEQEESFLARLAGHQADEIIDTEMNDQKSGNIFFRCQFHDFKDSGQITWH